MKNKLTLLTIAILLSLGIYAQPNLVNYQAVARDAAGVPLIATPVTVDFDIIQSSPGGTVVYSETHNSTTNQFGLFNLEIGGGTPNTGTFAGINWSTGLYYLRVTINGNAMPATQLLSVPYALHANTATSGTPGQDGNDNLSIVTPEPPGSNCTNGGSLVQYGVDDNANGSLDLPGEMDGSYYVCNGLNGGVGNDTSATNELQSLSISNDTLFISNGNFIVLPPALGDNWGTDVVNIVGPNISGDGTAGNPLAVFDNDTSATNELELPMTGNTIGDVLKWNGSNWVSANDSVDDADNDPANEIQDLSVSGNTINITGGTGANVSAIAPNTGDYLYWNGVNWVAQTITGDNWGTDVVNTSGGNISGDGTAGNPLMVTDNDTSATNELQTLTYNSGTQNLSISGGNSITLDVNDADNDPNNERITTFSVNGTNDSLVIVEAGVGHAMPLSDLSDGDWTKGAGFIYNNTDDIVVGTNVTDNSRFQIVKPNSAGFMALKLGNSNQPTREWSFDVHGNGFFSLEYENNGSPYTALYFNETNRHLGVFTASPQQNLHVEGFNSILRLQSTQSTTTANSYIEFGNTIAGSFDSKGYIGNTGSGDHLEYNALTFHRFTTQGTERMRLTNAGDLILGNFSAFSQLDVAGQITMRTGATAGYIPVSNANGTMTWTDPSTISTASLWSSIGSDIYFNTGNVGIGLAAPATTLDILSPNSTIINAAGSNAGGAIMDIDALSGPQVGMRFSNGGTRRGGLMYDQGVGALHAFIFGAPAGEGLYLTSANQYVGIGTNTPNRKLTVLSNLYGISHTSAAATLSTYIGNTYSGAGNVSGGSIGTETDNPFFIYVNNNGEKLYIGNSVQNYNVGIGTNTPQNKLDVEGGVAIGPNYSGTSSAPTNGLIVEGNVGIHTTTAGFPLDVRTTSSVRGAYIETNGSNSTGSKIGVTGISTNGAGTGINKGGAFNAINGTGGDNYGVDAIAMGGASNQRGVNALASGGSATNYGIYASATGGATNYAGYFSSGDVYITNRVGVGINPSTSVKLYSSTSSEVYAGYNITTYNYANATYGVYGRANNGVNASGEGIGVYGRADANGSYAYGVYGITGGTATSRYGVYCSGNGGYTGSWSAISDRKFKENVVPFENALDRVLQLETKEYNYKTEGEFSHMNLSEGKQIGFIAQEVEKVFPTLVENGAHPGKINEETGEHEEAIEYKGMNYIGLIPVLTKAIQEQQEMIEELKQEIQDLKNQ